MRAREKKIFVSVKEHGKKNSHTETVQCYMNGAYSLFKQQYPNKKIGFSTFCEIRPRNVVIAGACDTYSVCLYIAHIKLQI